MIGSESATNAAALGISSSEIWRIPLPISARMPGQRRAGVASRLSAGNSTVATATENIPCGSM